MCILLGTRKNGGVEGLPEKIEGRRCVEKRRGLLEPAAACCGLEKPWKSLAREVLASAAK